MSCECRRQERCWFDPWVIKIAWRRKWQPTPVFLPRKSHGQRTLVGYSPWGQKSLTPLKLPSTQQLHSIQHLGRVFVTTQILITVNRWDIIHTEKGSCLCLLHNLSIFIYPSGLSQPCEIKIARSQHGKKISIFNQ